MSISRKLSTEILLEIFSHLSLTSIIQTRGVCRFWRDCVLEADIHPMRRSLLDLYMLLLEGKIFIASRQHVIDSLQSFDRKSYVRSLQSQLSSAGLHSIIPPAFELYVLEWPEKAVFDCIWPGLPFEYARSDGHFRRTGWNFLSTVPPQLFEITVSFEEPNPHLDQPFAALPIWEANGAYPTRWLGMDATSKLFGRVLKANHHVYEYPDDSDYFDQTPVEDHEDMRLAWESTRLDFCDWLHVAAQRLELDAATKESLVSEDFYDKEGKCWRPILGPGMPPEPPMSVDWVQTGGDMLRFKPLTDSMVATSLVCGFRVSFRGTYG
jgi:hypothetical protein